MESLKIQKSKGFTLIELMVATTLFTIIMMMGVGSLVVSSNSAKASQKLRIAVDNVNFAMESMTRELRTGTYYYCGVDSASFGERDVKDCPLNGDAGNVIAFKPQQTSSSSPLRIAYKLSPRNNGTNTNTLVRCESPVNCMEVVSSEVDVQTLKFYVKGSIIDDNIQPSVQILVKGIIRVKDIDTQFVLQSMTSQRSSEKE